jgi:alpha-L-fucosidase
MANYSNKSPWFDTESMPGYLSYLNARSVSAETDDYLYTIESKFNYRPDLLSFAVYGTPKLWWVFMQRNMDVIRDPIFDFKAGTQIYVPKKSSLFEVLGI